MGDFPRQETGDVSDPSDTRKIDAVLYTGRQKQLIKADEICIASYLNFLIVNGGVIVPQYGDENDALSLSQIREIFPDREVVGVMTREIVYGGGNIHCITQQVPARNQKEV